MSAVLDAITTITLEDADGLWPGTICVTGFSAKTPALGVNHSGGFVPRNLLVRASNLTLENDPEASLGNLGNIRFYYQSTEHSA